MPSLMAINPGAVPLGVLQNLAGCRVDSNFVGRFATLDIEGVAKTAASLSFSNSSTVIAPGRALSAIERASLSVTLGVSSQSLAGVTVGGDRQCEQPQHGKAVNEAAEERHAGFPC